MRDSLYMIRNYRPEDFDRYLLLRIKAREHGLPGHCASPEVLRESLYRPKYSHEQDLFVVEKEGNIVGYMDITPEQVIGRVILNCFIEKAHRRKGLATDFLGYAMHRARELEARVIHVNVAEDNAVAGDVLSRLGFDFVRRFLQLRLDLAEGCRWETGQTTLQCRPLRRGEEDRLTMIQNRSFTGTWGYNPNTVEEISYCINLTGCCPEDIILACDGGEIAGYCWTRIIPEAARGEKKGEVFMLGVEPDCRRRGAGREALLAGLSYLKSRGIGVAELTVDSENLAACALYRSVGFKVQSGSLWYEKAVD